MEASPRFSVVVASRGRPNHLKRTLRAVRQIDYPSFEIIVVGDEGAVAVARAHEGIGSKVVAFDEANLSAARNLGLSRAAGEFCAFIDDDAVPEPMWLRHHARALTLTGADASLGYVRGPDGIRFQSRFETIGVDSETRDIPVEGEAPFVPELGLGCAVKLVGTNMVIRRTILVRMGGFDPAYRYFLEDSDLSLRLAAGGHRVAVVPLAEVHHALAASSLRTQTRAMRSLYDIGRSTAIFLRRHLESEPTQSFQKIAARERRRLLMAMVRGILEPGDVPRLMTTLSEGWAEGLELRLPEVEALDAAKEVFQPVVPVPTGHATLRCRLLRRNKALAEARRAIERGQGRASVVCLALTGLPHSVCYTDDGIWLQTGGQFVATGATGGRFRWCRFAERVDDELRRVANRRGLADTGMSLGRSWP